jgi:isopropylmalate/homocitrate/citramalate synthase
MDVCSKAVAADVDVLVLCDTNGGALPWEIDEVMSTVTQRLQQRLLDGIHSDVSAYSERAAVNLV